MKETITGEPVRDIPRIKGTCKSAISGSEEWRKAHSWVAVGGTPNMVQCNREGCSEIGYRA